MHTGTSILYTILIFASRRAILDNEPTSLSSALGFLVRCTPRVIEPIAAQPTLPQSLPLTRLRAVLHMDEQ